MLAFLFVLPTGWKGLPSLQASSVAVTVSSPAESLESVLSPAAFITDFFSPARKDVSIETLLRDPHEKVVIYFEDAHANISAQKNIMRAMRVISRRAGMKVPWIALEGNGTGEIDARVLSAFPNKKIRARLAEYFLLKGKLNAADGFAALYNSHARLFGVDSESLAEENRKNYRDTLSDRQETEALLRKLERINAFLKGKIYKSNLAWLDRAAVRFEKNPDRFFEYLNVLQEEAQKNHISHKAYPHLSELIELKKTESYHREGEVADELTRLKRQRGLTDWNDEIALQRWSRDPAWFEGYPHLKNHVRMLERYHSLRGDSLWAELDRWTKALWNKLLVYPEARDAHAIDQVVRFYKKLFSFSLLPGEYAQYLKNPEVYSPSWLEAKIRHYDFLLKPEGLMLGKADQRRIDRSLQAPLHFYATAMQRNKPLVDHVVKLADQSPHGKIFFMAGGFHKKEITQALKARGIAYAVLTPKISSTEGQENYWKLLGGEKSDLEQTLAGPSAIALPDLLTKPEGRGAIMLLALALARAAHGTAAEKEIAAYTQRLSPADQSFLDSVSVRAVGPGKSMAVIGGRRFLFQFLRQHSEDAISEIPSGFDFSEEGGRLSIYAERKPFNPRSEVRIAGATSPKFETQSIGMGDEVDETAKLTSFITRLTESMMSTIISNAPESEIIAFDQERLIKLFKELLQLKIDESPQSIASRFIAGLGNRKIKISFENVPQLIALEDSVLPGNNAELVLKVDWAALQNLGAPEPEEAERFLTFGFYHGIFEHVIYKEGPRGSKEHSSQRLARETKVAGKIFTSGAGTLLPASLGKESRVTPLAHFINYLLDIPSAKQFWTKLVPELIKTIQKADLIGGRYLLLRLIAQGGFGIVYKAYDVQLGRIVAIKELKLGHYASPIDMERVRREIEVMKQMEDKAAPQFPHISDKIYAPEDEKRSSGPDFVPPKFLVMSFVQGKRLNDWIPEAGKPFDHEKYLNGREMLEVAVQILEGLQNLHDLDDHGKGGIVHRDIKPSNIMVYRDEKHQKLIVKILDFGLAKWIGEAQTEESIVQTSKLSPLGTPAYMAPEQFVPLSQLSPAEDVYAAGLTFIEMITGILLVNPPSAPTNALAVLMLRHQSPDYHKLDQFKGIMDEELLKILEKMIGIFYEGQPEKEKTQYAQNAKASQEDPGPLRPKSVDGPLMELKEYLQKHPGPFNFSVLGKSNQAPMPTAGFEIPPAVSAVSASPLAEPPAQPAARGVKSLLPKILLGGAITLFLLGAIVIGTLFLTGFFQSSTIPLVPIEKDKEGKIKPPDPVPMPKMKKIEVWNGEALRSKGVEIYSRLERATGADFFVSQNPGKTPYFTDFNSTPRHALFPQEISVTGESEFKLSVKIYRAKNTGFVEIGLLELLKEEKKDSFTGIRFDANGVWKHEKVPVRFERVAKDAGKASLEFEDKLEKNKKRIGPPNFKEGWVDLTLHRLPGKNELVITVDGESTTLKADPGKYNITARVLSEGVDPKNGLEKMPFRVGPMNLEMSEETKKEPVVSGRSELRSAIWMTSYKEKVAEAIVNSDHKIPRPKVLFLVSGGPEALKKAELRFGAVKKIYGMEFVRTLQTPEQLRPETLEMRNILSRAAGSFGIPLSQLELIVFGTSASAEIPKKTLSQKADKTDFFYMPLDEKRFAEELSYRTAYLLLLNALRNGRLAQYGIDPQQSWIQLPESLVSAIQRKLEATLAQERAA